MAAYSEEKTEAAVDIDSFMEHQNSQMIIAHSQMDTSHCQREKPFLNNHHSFSNGLLILLKKNHSQTIFTHSQKCQLKFILKINDNNLFSKIEKRHS